MSDNFQTLTIVKNASNQSIAVYCKDYNGDPKTGLVAADISCYIADMSGQYQNVTTRDLTSPNDSHVGGGFIEISATNIPGLYRFDIPDAVFNTDRYAIIYLRCGIGIFTVTGINVADIRYLSSELPSNVLNLVLSKLTANVLNGPKRKWLIRRVRAELQRL